MTGLFRARPWAFTVQLRGRVTRGVPQHSEGLLLATSLVRCEKRRGERYRGALIFFSFFRCSEFLCIRVLLGANVPTSGTELPGFLISLFGGVNIPKSDRSCAGFFWCP